MIAGLVQAESRMTLPLLVKAPFEEQKLAEAAALDPFQKLLRNNRVRIHVNPVDRRDETVSCLNGSMLVYSSLLRSC